MIISREKLLQLGFKRKNISELGHKIGLILYLKQDKNRVLYRLRWHEIDEPEKLLIDYSHPLGWITIDEKDFLTNTNGLPSNAIKNYKEIIKKLGDEDEKMGTGFPMDRKRKTRRK